MVEGELVSAPLGEGNSGESRLPILLSGTPNPNCQACEDLLDLYVDDELQSHDVQQLYPSIWHHLHVCRHCRQAHDLLAETLDPERRGELPATPHRSSTAHSDIKPHNSDPI